MLATGQTAPWECGSPSSMKQKLNGGRRATRTPKNERLRQRSRGFVEAGLLRPGEAAKVAAVSIALMHAWTKDIDWRAARARAAKRIWGNNRG